MRECLYCGGPIPDDRHKNAWTCTKEHALLLKKEREANNYIKVRTTADPIIMQREHFNDLAEEFGFEVPIDLNYVSPFKIDWSLKTGTFIKEGCVGVALGVILGVALGVIKGVALGLISGVELGVMSGYGGFGSVHSGVAKISNISSWLYGPSVPPCM
jgi:hypothetical protein